MTVWNDGRRAAGRVALVTGAGGKCGGAIARAWAREGGAAAIGYRNSEGSAARVLKEIQDAGGEGHIGQIDVTDEASVSRFVEEAAARYGRIDVVVNPAGRWTDAEDKRFADATSEAFAMLLNVDVLGTFRVCKAALNYLRATGNGAIVNFTTAYGPGLNPDNPVNSLSATYCAAKGAVRAFTVALARDLAPEIRVNAVAPGPITLRKTDTEEINRNAEEVLAATPMKRTGDPGEIAETVMYLTSAGAGYTTGQVIEVSGGWTLDW
jgi:3-oxoacyl-[acyl-carrier protein] reductase